MRFPIPFGLGSFTARHLAQLGMAAALCIAAMDAIGAPPNKAPLVSITAPTTGAIFTAGANITIGASASDVDGTVAKVDVYRGGTILLKSMNASPYSFVWSNVPTGSYSLTAIATDNLGATKSSTAVAIAVNPAPSSPPSVSIVSPASGSVFFAPATVTLTANASDSDGSVTKVDFFQGANLLNPSATTPPYSITLPNLGPGSYSFTARATDNAGAATNSAAINIVVGPPNLPPLVVLTAPLPCSVYDVPASMVLTADAIDPDGEVSKVDFLQGGNLIGTASAAPHSFTWTGVPAGVYALAARATDKLGATTTSTPVTVTVRTANLSPLVSLTAPTSGATFYTGAPIALAATASDSDGTVRQVDFLDGGNVVATAQSAPYTGTWSTTVVGNHTLTARATDNANGVASSSPVMVTIIANQPPTVDLTAPAAGSRYLPAAVINVTASASDSDGSVSKVEFFADGISIGASAIAPFTAAWATAVSGKHVLTATATDNRGANTAAAPVNISIDAPPVITLAAPTDGAVYPVPGNFMISAHATDSDGTLAKVELFRDGVSMSAATPPAGATNFTLNYLWNPAPAGSYILTAQAIDNDGALTTSAPVRIAVHAPPSVTLTSPVAGSIFLAPAAITLTAAPVVAGATVSKVDFYAGTTPLGTASGAPPFSIPWSNVPAGSYSLNAVVTDNLGGIATSPSVSITVSNDSPPAVSLAAPANGATYFAPATVNLTAVANDSDGNIAQVDFYQGSTRLGTAYAPPYALAWTNVLAGNYVVTAAAQDNQGARTTSAPINFMVTDTGLAITSPADGSTVSDSVVNIAGNVQAPANSGVTVNGIIAALDGAGHFYANGVPLATGANTITATLTAPNGQISTQSIALSSTGPGPILISASPAQGLSPLDVTFTASAQAGTTIQKMELDWNSDGIFDFTRTMPDWSMSLGGLSVAAGSHVFSVTVRVTDTQANVYTKTLPIVVTAKPVLDQQLRTVWNGMLAALAEGDKGTAMQFLNASAKTRYGPVFDALLPQIAQIVGSFSPLQSLTLSSGIGEYIVNRTINGEDRAFLIYLTQDGDGVWRLNSM